MQDAFRAVVFFGENIKNEAQGASLLPFRY